MRVCYENGVSCKELALETPSNEVSANISLPKIEIQDDAPLDLDDISWAPGETFSSLKGYAFNANAGRETFMYVVENGIYPENPVRQ